MTEPLGQLRDGQQTCVAAAALDLASLLGRGTWRVAVTELASGQQYCTLLVTVCCLHITGLAQAGRTFQRSMFLLGDERPELVEAASQARHAEKIWVHVIQLNSRKTVY